MKDAKIIDANEIKQILAEKFGVPIGNIIKMQYSFAIILNEESEVEEDR